MVAVFAVFATLQFLYFKEFGIGLAVAVLIDATIVRGVLLPATMKLLGERTGTCRGGSGGCPGPRPSCPSRPRPPGGSPEPPQAVHSGPPCAPGGG